MPFRGTIRTAVLTVLALAAVAAAVALLASWRGSGGGGTPAAPAAKLTPAPVVRTQSGRVRGAVIAGVPSYLGIPYAAPPVGPLRWRPPQPAASWGGVRACVTYGASCPQTDSGYQTAQTEGEFSEDCLYLNVYTPSTSPDEPLPVMVWIHGGGFTSGSGVLPNFQGQTLAGDEQVVVVSMNYRLGVFGFFALPALSAESAHGVSGNYGIMDQAFALRWVRRNIAAFGGDPRRVTMFGQSAGGQSVLAHYVSPLSRGLFARAIAESPRYQDFGIGLWATLPLDAQEAEGEDLSLVLGIPDGPGQLTALRDMSVDRLLAVSRADPSPYPLGFVRPAEPSFQPVVDGYVIPEQVWQLLATGRFPHVPLLIGSNAEECNMWVSTVKPSQAQMVDEGARAEVQRYMGDLWTPYAALFPAAKYPSPLQATSKMMTVAEFFAPARYAAHCVSRRGVPAYLYYFTQEPPGTTWGAVHCAEIPYVFGTERNAGPYGEPQPADIQVSATMSGFWTAFAAAGDPNAAGLPRWPRYHGAHERLMRIGSPLSAAIHVPYTDAADLVELAAKAH